MFFFEDLAIELVDIGAVLSLSHVVFEFSKHSLFLLDTLHDCALMCLCQIALAQLGVKGNRSVGLHLAEKIPLISQCLLVQSDSACDVAACINISPGFLDSFFELAQIRQILALDFIEVVEIGFLVVDAVPVVETDDRGQKEEGYYK